MGRPNKGRKGRDIRGGPFGSSWFRPCSAIRQRGWAWDGGWVGEARWAGDGNWAVERRCLWLMVLLRRPVGTVSGILATHVVTV